MISIQEIPVEKIDRSDISEELLDSADTIMEITDYGVEHGCIGHTFVVKNEGIGGEILEKAIKKTYEDYGVRSIALGCHKSNRRAARFYERHHFVKTGYMEGNDEYYLCLVKR